MHQSFVRSIGIACLSVVSFVAVGCSDGPYQTAEVTGTVTCNGEPAHGGVIRFHPHDAPDETGRPPGEPGRVAYATVQEDGTFRLRTDTAREVQGLDGALIGKHDVSFEAPRTRRPGIPGAERDSYTEEQLEIMQAGLDAMPIYDPLPCGTTVTPDAIEVKAGEDNVFEFTLEAN